MRRQNSKQRVEFGFAIPLETAERIEKVRDPYITRSKFILKAIDRLLHEEEEKQTVARGLKGFLPLQPSTTTNTSYSVPGGDRRNEAM
jgi:metal-responsive CopG/Arc/MetJ family transcriptional regulator